MDSFITFQLTAPPQEKIDTKIYVKFAKEQKLQLNSQIRNMYVSVFTDWEKALIINKTFNY